MILKDHRLAFPIVDICDPDDNSTSREKNTSTGELSDEQLGKEILARVEAGEKARAQAADRFISAGLRLIEAKFRVPDFSAFLRGHCPGLSRSRAYELIKIAGGDVEKVRANTNERKRRHRAKRNSTAAAAHVRSGTDIKSELKAVAVLAEFEAVVNALFPRMDDGTRQAALAFAANWRNACPASQTDSR